MDIGIGLPTTLPVEGTAVVEWARRAEERGFSALATIDRVVYPNYDSLTALAAAAGATSRIGLFPDILLAPAYPPVWLAKATGSLHALSGGRLTLGLGVGGRPDDFAAVDRPYEQRGRLMDETLALLHRAWAGEPVAGGEFAVSPTVPGGKVPILVGGNGAAAVRRTVAYGDGWTVGGATPQLAAEPAAQIRAAWQEAGREGEPRLAALTYYGFGADDTLARNLRHYYGFLGDMADFVVTNAVRTPEEARQRARDFADAGFTELMFDPAVPDLDQVDRLADAVL
ncbi:MAG TPA: LLM class flavin-dependent oxidoreductase [Mycobacteriales bacterium]|nr:LLM class flavin-dependent oxidoreductase [Mycobacteriales bacterium]